MYDCPNTFCLLFMTSDTSAKDGTVSVVASVESLRSRALLFSSAIHRDSYDILTGKLVRQFSEPRTVSFIGRSWINVASHARCW